MAFSAPLWVPALAACAALFDHVALERRIARGVRQARVAIWALRLVSLGVLATFAVGMTLLFAPAFLPAAEPAVLWHAKVVALLSRHAKVVALGAFLLMVLVRAQLHRPVRPAPLRAAI